MNLLELFSLYELLESRQYLNVSWRLLILQYVFQEYFSNTHVWLANELNHSLIFDLSIYCCVLALFLMHAYETHSFSSVQVLAPLCNEWCVVYYYMLQIQCMCKQIVCYMLQIQCIWKEIVYYMLQIQCRCKKVVYCMLQIQCMCKEVNCFEFGIILECLVLIQCIEVLNIPWTSSRQQFSASKVIKYMFWSAPLSTCLESPLGILTSRKVSQSAFALNITKTNMASTHRPVSIRKMSFVVKTPTTPVPRSLIIIFGDLTRGPWYICTF